MRVLRFDFSETWNNPSAIWNYSSYVLEKDDHGYINPNPTTNIPSARRSMSNNKIPEHERPLLALGEDCADGCHALEDVTPLKLVREDDLRAALFNLKGDLAAQPPVLGLVYRFNPDSEVRQRF